MLRRVYSTAFLAKQVFRNYWSGNATETDTEETSIKLK